MKFALLSLFAVLLLSSSALCQEASPPVPPAATGHVVGLCNEYHGFAGEASGSFTLQTPSAWRATGNQRYVLYARGLSQEASVQLEIAGKQVTPDEPYVTDTLPSSPVPIRVIKRSVDNAPFTFISFVANSEDCRLPLDESHLVIPLPVIDGTPATVYFYAQPRPPFTFFSLEVSGNQRVEAKYRLDLSTPMDRAVDVPMNTPVSGAMSSTERGLYMVARAAGAPVDVARFSIAWSLPPPGWNPPTAEGSDESNGKPTLAEQSGSFFGDLLLFLIFGFVGYLVGRSVYNYRALGIRTYPEYIPHHAEFAQGFAVVKHGFETAKSKMNMPSAGIPGVGPTGPSFPTAAPGRRGYERVDSVQP
jgi:hypothetical protein